MLKKKSRDVRFLKISLQSKAKNSKDKPKLFTHQINGNDPLKECFSILKFNKDEENRKYIYFRNKGRFCRALRRFSEDTENGNNIITLLWGGGDKETAFPFFWNEETDGSREEPAKEGERVAYSAHMLINLNFIPQLGGYIACLEDIPNLGKGAIKDAINKFFHDNIQINISDPEDPEKNITQIMSVELEDLASRSFDEAMMGGRSPFEIVAEAVSNQTEFDENFLQTEKISLSLKATPNTPLEQFKKAFSTLRRRRSGYKKYIIKYREPDKSERSMSAENSSGDADDLNSYTFIQRDKILLENEVKQFCTEIHPELKNKMKNLLLAEARHIGQNA